MPRPATALIGRGAEHDAVLALLARDETRLVTLLGPGGVGKTRLALAVAEALVAGGGTDVVFVDLAPIRDPNGVLGQLAEALDLPEGGGGSPELAVTEALTARSPLVILDNFEQLLPAAALVARMVEASPATTFLVTSRIPLRLRGEQQIVLPPLALPARVDPSAVETIEAIPAVALFVERARAVHPGFAVTPDNARDVVEICRRVDGLPLAIELIAARTRLLSPAALLARLTNRLSLLSAGAADLSERHQTMRDAIAWSVGLLAPNERAALAIVSIFAGSFAVDAAEAIVGGPATGDGEQGRTDDTGSVLDHAQTPSPSSLLDALTSLTEKSLLQTQPGPPGEVRLRLLETVREYVTEELSGELDLDAARDRHAAHFAALAARAEPELMGPDQVAWLNVLAADHDNLRAALAWLQARGNRAALVRLVGDLWPFWYAKGVLAEGRRWITTALERPGEATPEAQARALNGLGAICHAQADYAAAIAACERAVEQWQAVGDQRSTASVLNNLAVLAERQGRYDDAIRLHERALAIFRELGDRYREAAVLSNIAVVTRATGDIGRSRILNERALGIRRAIGDKHGIAASLNNNSMLLQELGDRTGALAQAEEALGLFEELDDPRMMANALNNLGVLVSETGDLAASDGYHRRALRMCQEIGDERETEVALHNLGENARAGGDLLAGMAFFREALERLRMSKNRVGAITTLETIARIASESGHAALAITLLAFTARLRAESGFALDPPKLDPTTLRSRIAEKPYAVAAENGRCANFDDIVDLAMAFDPRVALATAKPIPRAGAPMPVTHDLSPRELDVLRLVASGKSNAEIGEALFISPFTAKTHVANLLGKLGVGTRAAAAAWAAQAGILG